MRRTRIAIGLLAIAVSGVGLNTVSAGASPRHPATTTISQVSLDPLSTVAGTDTAAVLTVKSSACVTVQALTVAVRDAAGNSYDFPGAVNNVQICPSGYTLNTSTRTFTVGQYTAFGAYELGGVWSNLTSQTLHVGAAGTTARPSWASTGTYTLATGSDEFTGSTLASKWATGWYPPPSGTGPNTVPVNVGGSYPEQACYSPGNVSVSGGYLRLALTNAQSQCSTNVSGSVTTYTEPYTGSMVQTRNSFTQVGGSFEARVYLPPAAVSNAKVGGWPAWWLNGSDAASWPTHGEIDVVEGLGGFTEVHTHYDTGGGVDGNQGARSPDAFVGWHNFGASWNASTQQVTFWWDGSQGATLPMTGTLGQYLVFDNTIGTGSIAPRAFPSTMLVDWVRVWQ